MKFKLIMCLSVLGTKSQVTIKQVGPYVKNLERLKNLENFTPIMLEVLDLFSPENTIIIIDLRKYGMEKLIRLISFLKNHQFQIPKDMVSNDFKLKDIDILINFFDDIQNDKDISKNLKYLAKRYFNFYISNSSVSSIKNFFKEIDKKFFNEQKQLFQTIKFRMNLLSNKIGNISLKEQETIRNSFINTKQEELKNNYGIPFEESLHEIEKKADKLINIVANSTKEDLLADFAEKTDLFNDLYKSFFKILQFVNSEKLSVFATFLEENKDTESEMKMQENARKINLDFVKVLETHKEKDMRKSCADIINVINNITLPNTYKDSSSKNSSSKNSSSKKHFIIGGIVIAAAVVCGAIWYWKSNQNNNIQI